MIDGKHPIIYRVSNHPFGGLSDFAGPSTVDQPSVRVNGFASPDAKAPRWASGNGKSSSAATKAGSLL